MSYSSPTVGAKTELRKFWISCRLAADAWPEALRSYEQYYGLILAHNAAAGLMGKVSAADFYLKHVADSLAVLLAWPDLFIPSTVEGFIPSAVEGFVPRAIGGLAGEVRLADVGCGAGLPGIVLAIALPGLHLTAIESNQKKADFVKTAAGELGLAGRVEVQNRRSRELGHDKRFHGRFDVVTVRAVAPAEKIIRDCRMLLAPARRERSRTACREPSGRTGGSVILYKTPRTVADEKALARREARKHKLTLETSEPIVLPAGAGIRQFIRLFAPE